MYLPLFNSSVVIPIASKFSRLAGLRSICRYRATAATWRAMSSKPVIDESITTVEPGAPSFKLIHPRSWSRRVE